MSRKEVNRILKEEKERKQQEKQQSSNSEEVQSKKQRNKVIAACVTAALSIALAGVLFVWQVKTTNANKSIDNLMSQFNQHETYKDKVKDWKDLEKVSTKFTFGVSEAKKKNTKVVMHEYFQNYFIDNINANVNLDLNNYDGTTDEKVEAAQSACDNLNLFKDQLTDSKTLSSEQSKKLIKQADEGIKRYEEFIRENNSGENDKDDAQIEYQKD